MGNTSKTPMNAERARKIQSAVDRKASPTPQQDAFKRRTSSVAAKVKAPRK